MDSYCNEIVMEYKYPNCFRMYMSEGKAAWSYGVAVSTPDSESGDPGSNPGRTFFFFFFFSGFSPKSTSDRSKRGERAPFFLFFLFFLPCCHRPVAKLRPGG